MFSRGAGAAMAVTLLFCSQAAAQTRAPFPIAYISLQKILAEADDAKAAAKELEALRAAKAQELTTRRQTLDATKLQLANAGGFFAASRRKELRELERRQEAELQQATQQAQTAFQELQRKVQERLRNELNGILNTIARQRGFLYVLNQDAAVVMAPAGVDLTGDVLQQLNASFAKRSVEKDGAGKP